ncbi:MAG: aspartate kinase [Promethearchaeota archaeon]
MNELIIHKFGGSCLIDNASFQKTASIINKFSGIPNVIVLSAFKGVTDKLIGLMDAALDDEKRAILLSSKLQEFHVKMAKNTITKNECVEDAIHFINESFDLINTTIHEIFTGGLPKNIRDYVISFGERLSTYLFACFLKSLNNKAEFFSGDMLITTSSNFGSALPLMKETKEKVETNLIPVLAKNIIAVVTGFYGEDINKEITTLGRGGSDFTATILSNVLAENYSPTVIFWKDVDGFLTVNPTIEPKARLITEISYEEAKELAYFGSKVLHPLCLTLTMEKKIPVQIRNFNKDLKAPFTTISPVKKESKAIVKSIACINSCKMVTVQGAALVSLPGIAAKLFDILAKNGINILFISQASSENNITFVVNDADGERAVNAIKNSKFFGKAGDAHWIDLFKEDVSLLAIVGHGMAFKSGIAGKIFTALGEAGVNVRAIAQGSSELNISILISPDDLKNAVCSIHERFALNEGVM